MVTGIPGNLLSGQVSAKTNSTTLAPILYAMTTKARRIQNKKIQDRNRIRELRKQAKQYGVQPRLVWLTEEQYAQLKAKLRDWGWAANSPRAALTALKIPNPTVAQRANVPSETGPVKSRPPKLQKNSSDKSRPCASPLGTPATQTEFML
jgi:hypothetical protein